MSATIEQLSEVVIKFAGDSGDGMQLTGGQFTNAAALYGNDLATFPDFPAEIRAPQGTIPGVSGFQLHFSSNEIYTPGDNCDVLVAMNAAALKSNLFNLKKGGIIIVDTNGYDGKNLRLANYAEGANPLEDGTLDGYKVYKIDVTKLTRESLADMAGLGMKEKDRSKNMFVLGFLYWMYNRNMDFTLNFLNDKFGKKPEILESNIRVLKAGYNYGDTTETFMTRYEVPKAKVEAGTYRSIMGNQAVAMGFVAASQKSGLPLFLASYPITPASDILHDLSKYKNFGVRTMQCEDEIASICAAIGAAYGGNLAITTSSGPGIALKGEAIGLAVMMELPLVVVNIQRGGPSTGLPTKTEQADLLQALYGRNGECPMVVISTATPSDCFEVTIEACRIALQHMVPVMLLSDGYIANGAEPWKFPKASDIAPIEVKFKTKLDEGETKFLPYKRDEKLARPWVTPGTPELMHRLGGLEKQHETGNVSYDPENHEFMIKMRAAKVEKVADYIPLQKVEVGAEKGKILVLGWGSTYGSIKSTVLDLIEEGYSISHAHVRYMNPLPKNLGDVLKNFEHVIMPEINSGQFIKVVRDKYLVDAKGYNKTQGTPISKTELKEFIKNNYSK